MSYLGRFFSSMGGRLFVLLALGMAASALIATALTNLYSNREFERQLDERTADLLQAYAEFLDAAPRDVRERMLRDGGPGIHHQPDAVGGATDARFQAVMAARGGLLVGATAQTARLDICFPEILNLPIADMAEALQRMRGFLVAGGASFVPPE